MTLQSLGTAIGWPGYAVNFAGTPTVGFYDVLDAAGEYTAWMGPAREAMSISHFGFRTGTIGGTGTVTAEIRIVTVDATTGLPTDTLVGTNTSAFTAGLTSNTWVLTALTAPAAIAAGSMFAVKLRLGGGTSPTVQFSYINNIYSLTRGVPYLTMPPMTAKVLSNITLSMALGSSATTFYHVPGMLPAIALNYESFGNSGGFRGGLRFKVPFKCRCVGMRTLDFNAIGNYDIALYSDGGTLLESTAYDEDQSYNASVALYDLYFDAPVTLDPGTWYRLVRTPTTSTIISITYLQMPSANYISAFPFSANAHLTTYTTAGNWVDSATDKVPFIDLLIDQLDDGAGGGALMLMGRSVL